MHWILQFIIRHKTFTSLFITSVISIWFILASPIEQQKIASALTSTIFFPAQYSVNTVTRIKLLFEDNARLKKELIVLQTELALLSEAKKENIRLKKLIGFKIEGNLSFIPALTVVREPVVFFKSIIIDKGSRHKVKKGMPVINRKGLVGKIYNVLPSVSMVKLLRDPSNKVGVMNMRNSVASIMETKSGREFFVKYRKHTDIKIGDTIVTSGYGGIYPRGLYVGVVKKIEDIRDNILFKNVIIKPFVDFDHLEEVFIIEKDPEWYPLKQEIDSLKKAAGWEKEF